jgi:hypothetical protein
MGPELCSMRAGGGDWLSDVDADDDVGDDGDRIAEWSKKKNASS